MAERTAVHADGKLRGRRPPGAGPERYPVTVEDVSATGFASIQTSSSFETENDVFTRFTDCADSRTVHVRATAIRVEPAPVLAADRVGARIERTI